MRKVYITSDDSITFSCPDCHFTRMVDAGPYKDLDRQIRIRVTCPCGHQYPVLVERRRQFRRPVHLRGSVFKVVDGRWIGKGEMTVNDVSRTGLRIGLEDGRQVRRGDRLFVQFCLDDPKRSVIEKEVIVRKIHGRELGAEFAAVDPLDPNMKAIGFYLMG
jgi:hypothetical protein